MWIHCRSSQVSTKLLSPCLSIKSEMAFYADSRAATCLRNENESNMYSTIAPQLQYYPSWQLPRAQYGYHNVVAVIWIQSLFAQYRYAVCVTTQCREQESCSLIVSLLVHVQLTRSLTMMRAWRCSPISSFAPCLPSESTDS